MLNHDCQSFHSSDLSGSNRINAKFGIHCGKCWRNHFNGLPKYFASVKNITTKILNTQLCQTSTKWRSRTQQVLFTTHHLVKRNLHRLFPFYGFSKVKKINDPHSHNHHHHHITTPPHHLITSSPHHLIPTLLVTTSPHHFITTPLVTTSPHHFTIVSPHPSSPHHLITSSPHHLITRWPSTHQHITTSQESRKFVFSKGEESQWPQPPPSYHQITTSPHHVITTSLITTSPHHRVITMSSLHHQITSSPHHTITSSPSHHIITSQGSRKSREYEESRCEDSRQSTVPFARPELEIAVELFRESDALGRVVHAMVSVVSVSPNLLNLQLTSNMKKAAARVHHFLKGVVQCLGQPCIQKSRQLILRDLQSLVLFWLTSAWHYL